MSDARDQQPREKSGKFTTWHREAPPPPKAWNPPGSLSPRASESFLKVLQSAARLQKIVPDAVLVGGSAAAAYVGHRDSTDHDHVIQRLREDYDLILDALEREGDFVFTKGTPQKIILGELGGIEVGVRQLMRERPLEVQEMQLPGGHCITVPTKAEILRVKAYLIVKRNQVRDYLDVAALSNHLGAENSAATLRGIDGYYSDPSNPDGSEPVRSQLRRQLIDPKPADTKTIAKLSQYKNLLRRWQDWDAVTGECRKVGVLL